MSAIFGYGIIIDERFIKENPVSLANSHNFGYENRLSRYCEIAMKRKFGRFASYSVGTY